MSRSSFVFLGSFFICLWWSMRRNLKYTMSNLTRQKVMRGLNSAAARQCWALLVTKVCEVGAPNVTTRVNSNKKIMLCMLSRHAHIVCRAHMWHVAVVMGYVANLDVMLQSCFLTLAVMSQMLQSNFSMILSGLFACIFFCLLLNVATFTSFVDRLWENSVLILWWCCIHEKSCSMFEFVVAPQNSMIITVIGDLSYM
jgi:hypothetical protein